jgi:hypothetical protein
MRKAAAVWLVLVAAAPASTGAARQATRSTRPFLILTLDVPATAPWTDTGIVVLPGDRLQIRAWGTAKFADAGSPHAVGPQGSGQGGGGCTYVVTDPSVPAHGLIGNVAPAMTFDGGGFFIGSSWSGTVPIAGATASDGRLLLGFNDRAMMCDRSGYDSWAFRNNNSGSFMIEVTVRR